MVTCCRASARATLALYLGYAALTPARRLGLAVLGPGPGPGLTLSLATSALVLRLSLAFLVCGLGLVLAAHSRSPPA